MTALAHRRDNGAESLLYRLVAEPRAARRARRVVEAAMDGWGLDGLADDVMSCVSELVANVDEHADSAIAELFLVRVPGNFLTAEVRDQDARLPVRSDAAESDPSRFVSTSLDADDMPVTRLAEAGRGLAVVEALCDRLTWRQDGSGGKLVRCYWRLKPAANAPDTHPAMMCP